MKILNEALATEIIACCDTDDICRTSGIHAEGVAAEFLQHANEEQGPREIRLPLESCNLKVNPISIIGRLAHAQSPNTLRAPR